MIKNLEQDVRMRKFLFAELREAGLDRVEIERSGQICERREVNFERAGP